MSGGIQGERRDSVIKTLMEKGYFLINVEREASLASLMGKGSSLRNPVRVKEKAVFTHQLATLLRAGMQLSRALKTLAKQTENPYLASIINQLCIDIEESSSLSMAMRKHPATFSSVYTAIVEAAEESGSLPETLSVLSNQLKTQSAVHARIRGAMVYPLFLLCVSVIVVGVLTTFVVPKFIEMFVNSNQELPLPTKLLDMGMTFVKDSWWVVLIGLAGLTGLVMIALREKRLRLSLDHTLMRMPLFGQVNQKLQIARFARTLGSLMRGGVRIVEAINTTRGVTSNLAFERGVSNIETQLLKGSTLAKAIEEQPYFSEITSNMVAVGEETGMLPEMLLEVADMYDQECESAINSVTTLLGPLMIVVLGAIVGFVVVAILLPIFRTSTMIG